MRRKLYEHLDNSLPDRDTLAVKGHLEICDKCRVKFEQMKSIVGAAGEKKAPVPNEEFWHNFNIDLDRKLNEKLVRPPVVQHAAIFRVRPAFAYISALLFVCVIAGSFYRKSSIVVYSQQDEDLVDGIVELDELGQTSGLDHNEDAYLEDITLAGQLNQL
jgi:hypothetical protein